MSSELEAKEFVKFISKKIGRDVTMPYSTTNAMTNPEGIRFYTSKVVIHIEGGEGGFKGEGEGDMPDSARIDAIKKTIIPLIPKIYAASLSRVHGITFILKDYKLDTVSNGECVAAVSIVVAGLRGEFIGIAKADTGVEALVNALHDAIPKVLLEPHMQECA